MGTTLRRFMVTAGATVSGLALLTGTANAHFCYLVKASERSDAGRAGSNGWNTFEEDALSFFSGMCDDGVEVLATAAGVSPSTPVLAHSVLANGTLRNGKGHDVPGVGYLNFGAIEAAVPAAFAACAPA